MNRPLRFRVWDTKEKRWASLECFIGDGYTDINDKNDDLIITQFTGLKDSKGRDIYEGDVVLFNTADRDDIKPIYIQSPVIFSCGHFVVDHPIGIPISNPTLEIVGNIFEHKHLLK